MKTIYRLADFEGKFADEDCLIVCSGPTTYDYQELCNHTGPIAFINTTITIAHYAGRRSNLFFSTIHPELFVDKVNQVSNDLGIIAMLPKLYLPDYMDSDLLLYNWREQCHTSDPNAATNELFCASNSTLPPIHLFYLAGCKQIKFIGGTLLEIDGEVVLDHDHRLDPQWSNWNAVACHKAIVDTCAIFGITPIFIPALQPAEPVVSSVMRDEYGKGKTQGPQHQNG